MPGSIWKLPNLETEASIHSGDQGGFDAAKAVLAGLPGLLQVGPGMEALILGGGWANISLVRVTNTGILAISRLHVADGADPTKLHRFDASAIGAGLTRVGTLPNWDGVYLLPPNYGVAGQFLQSTGPGAQPGWAPVSIINALLDGANHNDTLAGGPIAGDLIFANATPKWARLPKDTDGKVLTLVGGFPSWAVAVGGSSAHDLLTHLKPIIAANCTWNNGSPNISTSGNAFADVKVGDFIIPGVNATTGNVNRRVLTWNDANNIVADANNTGGTLPGVSLVFQPGDHWSDIATIDGTLTGVGLFLTCGRGDYHSAGGTTFQEIRGPVRWKGYGIGGIRTDFRVEGSDATSSGSPNGFALMRASSANRAYFHTSDLASVKTLRLGDPDANAQFVFQNPNGSGIGLDIMLDPAGLNARRTFGVPNLDGKITVRNAEGNHTGQTAAIGSTTLATAPPAGMYRVSGYMRCSAAGAAGPNVMQLAWNDGTARSAQTVCTLDLSGTNFGQGSIVIYVASGNVSYNVTYPGGSGTYDARIRMEAI